MRTVEEQHAQAALPDAAADGIWELAVQKHAMERQLLAVEAFGDLKLPEHGLFVHTDAHAGYLDSAAEGFKPEEQISVELPVIIVGSASVVRKAVGESSAYLLYKYTAVLMSKQILTFLRRLVGIHVKKLLRCDECDIARQLESSLRIFVPHLMLHMLDDSKYTAYGILEIIDGALFLEDDLLPVPLIHIN